MSTTTIRVRDLTSGEERELSAETPVILVTGGHDVAAAIEGRTPRAAERRAIARLSADCARASVLGHAEPRHRVFVRDETSRGEVAAHPGRYLWWESAVVAAVGAEVAS